MEVKISRSQTVESMESGRLDMAVRLSQLGFVFCRVLQVKTPGLGSSGVESRLKLRRHRNRELKQSGPKSRGSHERCKDYKE